MIKYFCDACGNEVDSLWSFGYRCHLSSSGRVDGYIDNDGNAVSGRDDSVELCPKCYNQAVSKAVDAVRKIQVANGIEPINKTYH
jgi:hypothetical protein